MSNSTTSDARLGTFLGVFTPTILTILGVIMYLRVGWLVGHLGLVGVLAVVLLAHAITLTTTLAFSAVATNARVGVGGAYFIISRSLGLELGGAIGVPLFLSQVFSVTLYAYGLAESFRIVWPQLPLMPTAFVVVIGVWVLAITGAEKALRAQVVLMGFVVLSLIALAVGAFIGRPDVGEILHVSSGQVGFWQGFAVFFPAVTGVMVGLGLSGDLRDPGRSIPFGSIAAVIVGLVVYIVVPSLLVMGASADDLRNEPLVWSRIAILGPWLVLPGLWSAIFSSAVGSVLAAPRTLQALARDGLAPKVLGRRTGDARELLPGMLVTLGIAVGAVLLGNLNAVAAVVSMFFLTVYGTVNIAASFEILSGDPSWRPKIRVPWWLTLFVGLACGAVMVLINPLAGVVALAAELSLWALLSRRGQRVRWGDSRRGIYEALIRWALIKLDGRPMSARNWRPHMLTFVVDPVKELDLIRFSDWFSQGRGVVTVCNLIVGDLEGDELDLEERRERIKTVIDTEAIVVFPEVDAVRTVVDGIVDVAQANGMAGLASNTVLVGWPESASLRADFLRVMRRLERLNKSFVLGRIRPRHMIPRDDRVIDVWWGGLERNGDLLLLLAHLLHANREWRDATIRIMSIASSELMKRSTEETLERLMPEIRVEAEVRVVLKPQDSTVAEVIHGESAESTVVFLGLQVPEIGEEEAYSERLERLAGDLPVVFFVKNSSVFIGELLESPEAARIEQDAIDDPGPTADDARPLPD